MFRTTFAFCLSWVLSAVAVYGDTPGEVKVAPKAERTAVKSFDEMKWMARDGETTATVPLFEAVPGIGKPGDMATLRVTSEMSLDGRFVYKVGVLVKGDKTREEFRAFWGINPATNTMHRWGFMSDGLALNGPVFKEGDDKLVWVTEGSAIPVKEPHLSMAKAMKVDKLKYYGETVFRRLPDGKGLGVTVTQIKIGGMPIPLPHIGKETVNKLVR